jgi:hypothetical protein
LRCQFVLEVDEQLFDTFKFAPRKLKDAVENARFELPPLRAFKVKSLEVAPVFKLCAVSATVALLGATSIAPQAEILADAGSPGTVMCGKCVVSMRRLWNSRHAVQAPARWAHCVDKFGPVLG